MERKKIVRYNGKTESYYGCTKPTELVRGKEYEVIKVEVRAWQTNYTLKGVEGQFNSCWFDDVSERPVFMALAHSIPTVGKRCECAKIEIVEGKLDLAGWSTSTVKEVLAIGKNIYQVTTCNSIYIVQVG